MDSAESIKAFSEKVRTFIPIEILNEDTSKKSVAILGKISNEKDFVSILLLEKSAFGLLHESSSPNPNAVNFDLKQVEQFLNSYHHSSLTENDIYSWADGSPHFLPQNPVEKKCKSLYMFESCGVKYTLIHPATEKHISKHSFQRLFTILETVQMYQAVTLDYIKNDPISRIQWVYNILESKAETDKVIYRNDDPLDGFVLLPDFKWDGVSLSSLYFIAFVTDKSIKSLRDISFSNLTLLKTIKSKATQAISAKYPDFDVRQLSFYVHYHPSYYLFHVHITNVNIDSKGCIAGRAHLLDAIIDNIENIRPDYYQVASIPLILGENHPLYTKLVNYKN
ncbi:m7GpppX diphosphatase [Smittium mucronatum]|uniref:m7GpppX diphosphatase n=1 Tax=Smittium mucronatum TaxID=133383 RepID=A0A1R0H4S5_9FUNG|nr:m7GpppX diphosphatase [Smittium mucronatum]